MNNRLGKEGVDIVVVNDLPAFDDSEGGAKL